MTNSTNKQRYDLSIEGLKGDTVADLKRGLALYDFVAPKSYKKAQLLVKLARFEASVIPHNHVDAPNYNREKAIELVNAVDTAPVAVDTAPVAPTTCPIEQAAWLISRHLSGEAVDLCVIDACFGVAPINGDKLGRTKIYHTSFWSMYIQYKNGVKVYTGRPVARELAKSGYMGEIDKVAGTLSLVPLVKRSTYTARKR